MMPKESSFIKIENHIQRFITFDHSAADLTAHLLKTCETAIGREGRRSAARVMFYLLVVKMLCM